MRCLSFFILLLVCPSVKSQEAVGLPDSVRQLIVTVAEDWNQHRAKLWLFQRSKAASPWSSQSASPTPVLLGKNGLAWGRGSLPVPHGQINIPSKRERDGRAPAGCFRIGMVFGYAVSPPPGTDNPYYQITERDCWIDDVTHPAYNKHIVIDLAKPPPWYEKQRMRLGDFAYEWLVEIRHNADPPRPGSGSAIFFHIRRGADSPTSGCTTMAKANLIQMIGWLKPEMQPHYILLPRAEYAARQKSWHLPAIP